LGLTGWAGHIASKTKITNTHKIYAAECERRHILGNLETDGGDDIEFHLSRVYIKIAQYVIQKIVK
jgi:hypothetical protein